jgi:hypothetical protein
VNCITVSRGRCNASKRETHKRRRKTARATTGMQVFFSLPVETPRGVQENTAGSESVGESAVCRSQLAASIRLIHGRCTTLCHNQW